MLRNGIILEGHQPDKEKLWYKCLFTTWSWLKAYKKDFGASFTM